MLCNCGKVLCVCVTRISFILCFSSLIDPYEHLTTKPTDENEVPVFVEAQSSWSRSGKKKYIQWLQCSSTPTKVWITLPCKVSVVKFYVSVPTIWFALCFSSPTKDSDQVSVDACKECEVADFVSSSTSSSLCVFKYLRPIFWIMTMKRLMLCTCVWSQQMSLIHGLQILNLRWWMHVTCEVADFGRSTTFHSMCEFKLFRSVILIVNMRYLSPITHIRSYLLL